MISNECDILRLCCLFSLQQKMDTRKSRLSKELLNNSLILENIFRFLSLKDHLKLIDICEEFRETIVQFLWRTSCKDLTITERSEKYLVNLNESVDYRIGHMKCFDFLQLNQFNVQKLQLKNCTREDLLRKVEHFENLTTLNMLQCKVSDANLQQLANNCGCLKTLTLDRCIEPYYYSELVLGRDIKVETLAQIASLRELHVFNRYKVKMNYETVQRVANQLQLTKFTLSCSIIYEGRDKYSVNEDSGKSFQNLEYLDIGRFSNINAWLWFVKMHLPRLENLQTLSIFIDLANCVLITDNIAAAIRNSCPHLIKLCFKQCKFQLNQFVLPTMLEHLSLVWCWGITWHNFHQMLEDHQLQTLISINVHYNGKDQDYFYHSDYLKTLTIETSLINDLTEIMNSSKCLFPQATTFNWLNSNESCHLHPHEIREDLSKIFPQLRKLRLDQAYLSVKEFRQMSCLQHLTMSLFDHMSWNYLITLLQSSSLNHLILDMPANITTSLCPILSTKPDWQLKLVPVVLTRNLKYLEIPLQLLNNALDFWLDFMDRSHDLRLKFYDRYSHELFNQNFLKTLLSDRRFPKTLKSLNICSINVGKSEIYEGVFKKLVHFCFF